MAVFTDVEGAVRTWLRTALPTLSGRVFMGVPSGTPTLPLVTVARIGGAPRYTEVPVEDVRLSCDVWASTKADASAVMVKLFEAIRNVSNDALDATTYAYTANIDNAVWQPDDEQKLARYVVDFSMTVRSLN